MEEAKSEAPAQVEKPKSYKLNVECDNCGWTTDGMEVPAGRSLKAMVCENCGCDGQLSRVKAK